MYSQRAAVFRTTVVFTVAIASIAQAQNGDVAYDLGTLPGTDSRAVALSADGGTAVGYAVNITTGRAQAFRWTVGGGIQALGAFGGESYAWAVSASGAVVAGNAVDISGKRHPVRWIAGAGMQDLGTLGGSLSRTYAISAGGDVVVGWATAPTSDKHAFRWTPGEGMLDLGMIGGVYLGASSEARAVSANGVVVAGVANNGAQNHAFRWTAASGMQDLGTLGGTYSYAVAVSASGDVIVGSAYNSAGKSHAFRWTADSGMQDLGTLGGQFSNAIAVTPDGTVVVGNATTASNQYHAFRWTAGGGMQDLGTLTSGGWSHAVAVSADGEVVVGDAIATSYTRAHRWTQRGGMQNLGTLGGTYSAAFAIAADGGVILGDAYNIADQTRACIWGDTDGDGLLDDWERNGGIPYIKNDGSEGRYPLLGANWLKKDIYVEVDAMSERSPSAATLQRVIDAFDPPDRVLVPPVPNVSGALPNITLHVETDTTGADLNLSLASDGNYTLGEGGFRDFGFDKSRYFGSPSDRTDPDWGTPAEPGPRRLAKLKAYRYCIFANTHSGGGSSGVAKGIPSNDFMVTLGAFHTPGGTPDQQAATFMHELGHTLGLGHGGGLGDVSEVSINSKQVRQQGINYKPNYYSIMNYWWQFPRGWQQRVPPYTGSAWGLRYSEAALPELNESELVESAGLGAAIAGARVPFVVPFVNCPGQMMSEYQNQWYSLSFARLDAARGADWNNDCFDQTPGHVSANLNALYDSECTRLGGHHDWVNLVYNFRASSTYAAGAPPENLDCDYTPELAAFMASLPPPCPADFNGDGFVNGDDYDAFAEPFENGQPMADINNDGFVNGDDYDLFAEYFETGC